MLRDVGVRTKLLAVLTIPAVLLVLVTGLLVGSQVTQAQRAGQVEALTEMAIQVNRVVHSLQEERAATLVHLEAPEPGTSVRMRSQRHDTNRQIARLRTLVEASSLVESSSALSAAIERSRVGHDELRGARASVDAGRFYSTEADVFYSRVIRADLDLPGVVAASGSAEMSGLLQAYQSLSLAIEFTAHERDLVEVGLLTGAMNEAEYAQTVALLAQQRQALQDFQSKAPETLWRSLDNSLAQAKNFEIDQVRRDLPKLLGDSQPDFGAAVEWVGDSNSRVSAMTGVENVLVADIGSRASDLRGEQERRALVLILLALLGLGLAALLAVNLARRITRPLRRLTIAAGQIGDELPRMVERMQTPGEGPGVEVEPIPVESTDEIGQLAEAFNTVNDVTVRVAKEQAALRASIAEMFVNVARRNQVLLGRQLRALDEMESSEEDPDALQRLFTLDHLATRMRRNAESLLVLAGIDSTRRLRSGLPLSDVIRTAVGEIEAYDRIDLSIADDPQISGRHALTIAHLLAELLENATHFSNPDTRVVVSAVPTPSGISVTITDRGLGMTDEEIADANAKIAHPPVAEIAVSQRLGLFVVGRLAQRLGATVELRRARTGGTTASVGLPSEVFEGAPAAAPELVLPLREDLPTAAPPADATVTVEPTIEVGDIDEMPAPRSRRRATARPDSKRRGWSFRRRSGTSVPAAADEPEVEPLETLEPAEIFEPVESVETLETVAQAPDVVEESGDLEAVLGAEPEPEPDPEPDPVAAPVTPPPLAVAPAVDILPSRGSGRLGRRGTLPTRRPAAAPKPVMPAVPVAPALPSRSARPVEPVPDLPPVAPAPAPIAQAPIEPAPIAQAPVMPAPIAQAPVMPAPLPARAAAPEPAPQGPPRQPAPALDDLASFAARSELASSALSELRGLYEPSFTPAVAPAPTPSGGLARRVPKPDPAASPAPAPAASATAARQRNAAEVRGMLAGFRAGVERGRVPLGEATDSTPPPAEHRPDQRNV